MMKYSASAAAWTCRIASDGTHQLDQIGDRIALPRREPRVLASPLELVEDRVLRLLDQW
jgi:hypothetical protein